jgi:hypothetical protein
MMWFGRVGVAVHIMEQQSPQKFMNTGFPLSPFDSYTFGSPHMMVNADLGKIALVEYVEPVVLWQFLQWQRPYEPQ